MPKRAHNFIDMAGQKFGRLTAVAPAFGSKRVYWECLCECGTRKSIYGANLRRGLVKSCGCLNQENRLRIDNKFRAHGQWNTPTYSSWQAMLGRCRRPKNKDWANYGGRGIKVCDRWLRFENFLADMGERTKGTTLDRKDTNGDYTPENCRWATPSRQSRNTRFTRRLLIDGQTVPLADLADTSGIGASTIRERLKRGWSAEDATSVAPLRKGTEILYPGKTPLGAAYKFVPPQPRRAAPAKPEPETQDHLIAA